MEYFIDALKNYATFSGRASRKQYWMFMLFYIIFYLILTLIDISFGVYDEMMGIGLLTTVYALGLFLPSLAILARRLHDIGRSGWWILLILIPLIGPIVILIFTLLDSQREENAHGVSPKYATNVITSE
ncbi:MAG: DUF805 domain-containing protein [Thiomicrorhabdus chilensis]|uniref:DUF805 domain-containing protein n=1 Tax=Thiomicrorhabdus chilensis TaxID=63656 RepID=UPI00299DCBAD|nr:DUF805 domain-containing protein [Thiomicrorhabdus chilensis]MDX1348531.1 DUF805 domain-containing protein [Thiomicrorhabdus chilensis]